MSKITINKKGTSNLGASEKGNAVEKFHITNDGVVDTFISSPLFAAHAD